MTGGTGIKGLYGTLTCLSIQLCLYAMVRKAGLRRSSVFVDIGSGINRVLFHALLYPAVEWAFGIEFDPVKVLKAVAAFDYLMQKMPVFKAAMKNKSAPPKANCASISEVGTLSPATHAFTFWVGMTKAAKMAIGRLWNNCPSLKAIMIVQHTMSTSKSKGWAFPEALMASLGFENIQLVDVVRGLKMSGSAKDTFRGYVFVKKSAAGPKDPAWAAEMERARAKFETDSVKVAEKEAKSAALDAARVAQLADQAAAAAAANRPTGAQQGTRRSSRVVRKTSLGVDDYFHKTDLQPDDDMYLGEEGKRAAEAEGKYIPCVHAEGWEVNANGVVRNVETKKAATCRTTKPDGKGDVFARLALQTGEGKGAKKVDRCFAVKHLVAVAWRPDDLAAKIPLAQDGGLDRRQGEWRIGHIDGNKFNNSAANLVLVPARR
ncbi:hypothetical protein PLESTM_000860300 [Pleodorina starrii]|nr:hypothetical protein PLESTM_000860300 [Pleodorina starrii]